MCINVKFRCPSCGTICDRFLDTYSCNHDPCVGMVGLQMYLIAAAYGMEDGWFCPQSTCALSSNTFHNQSSILHGFLEAQIQGQMGERSLAKRSPAMLTRHGSENIHHMEKGIHNVSAGVGALETGDQGSGQGVVVVDNQMLSVVRRDGYFGTVLTDWEQSPLFCVSNFEDILSQHNLKDTYSQQTSAFQQQDSTLRLVDLVHPTSTEDQYPADWTASAALEAQINSFPGPSHAHHQRARGSLQGAANVGESATPSDNLNQGRSYPLEWEITPELESQIAVLKGEIAQQTRALQPRDNRWVEPERKLLRLLRKSRPKITHHEVHEWFIPRHSGAACESDWSRQNKEEAAKKSGAKGL